ncbi:hypothetical protein [Salinibacter altiplanensis]|uniref:hypothetical protein n=1 Tax=Salinibacter altiplanensis TaxID=1803181 RepID=UPI0018F87E86|nr:hypothetical protein [Salinibacter altiplanensis]
MKPVYLRPDDETELKRVVSARGGYKSVPHLLRDYLSRSLLPRIKEGRYFPRRLLVEVAGRHSGSGDRREKIQLGLDSWKAVATAACALRGDLRRLEERRAWEGGAGPLPFYRIGTAEVVRAAAREIGTWSRGGPPELLSQEEAASWLGPDPARVETLSGEAASGEVPSGEAPSRLVSSQKDTRSQKDFGQKETHRETFHRETSHRKMSHMETYRVLPTLPGRDRGGKPVQFYVTEEAKTRLKEKGAQLNQTASDLLRRGTRLLVGWAERAPAEAYRHISEESRLYQGPREESGSGFQAYVSAETKRRVEEAKARLKRKPGYGAEADQTGILQAAARLALETEDQKMRPPLPGARPTGAGPTEAEPGR